MIGVVLIVVYGVYYTVLILIDKRKENSSDDGSLDYREYTFVEEDVVEIDDEELENNGNQYSGENASPEIEHQGLEVDDLIKSIKSEGKDELAGIF